MSRKPETQPVWSGVYRPAASLDPHHKASEVLGHEKRARVFETQAQAIAAAREIDTIIARLDTEIPRSLAEMAELLTELRRPAAA